MYFLIHRILVSFATLLGLKYLFSNDDGSSVALECRNHKFYGWRKSFDSGSINPEFHLNSSCKPFDIPKVSKNVLGIITYLLESHKTPWWLHYTIDSYPNRSAGTLDYGSRSFPSDNYFQPGTNGNPRVCVLFSLVLHMLVCTRRQMFRDWSPRLPIRPYWTIHGRSWWRVYGRTIRSRSRWELWDWLWLKWQETY